MYKPEILATLGTQYMQRTKTEKKTTKNTTQKTNKRMSNTDSTKTSG
jgi:hypothetical protein